MSDDAAVCHCNHNDGKQVDDLSYKKEKSGCCTNEVTVLSNSNLLSTVKVELPNKISAYAPFILAFNPNSDLYSRTLLISAIDKSHLLKIDISIFNSSLLI